MEPELEPEADDSAVKVDFLQKAARLCSGSSPQLASYMGYGYAICKLVHCTNNYRSRVVLQTLYQLCCLLTSGFIKAGHGLRS
jgi:hypothetical protein